MTTLKTQNSVNHSQQIGESRTAHSKHERDCQKLLHLAFPWNRLIIPEQWRKKSIGKAFSQFCAISELRDGRVLRAGVA